MAAEEDSNVECCSLSSVPGTSYQEPVLTSTSQLTESPQLFSRLSSFNIPVGHNSHSASRGPLNVTPKLEHSFWARFRPLVESLEEPLNQYLHIDVAYRGCLQQLIKCQKSLLQSGLSRNDIDCILDDVENELLCAQYLALWKRGVLLEADQSIYKLTGKKCDSNNENATVIKSKRKCKKTAVTAVKDSIRRSKRERSYPCTVKAKSKDSCRNQTVSAPRQSPTVMSSAVRTKRKNKRRESTSESTTSSKKRSSGRLSKPLRKKQTATPEACDVASINLNDEPTYCLCKQVSFGDMIGCDNDKCTVEWFHFECVQLKTKPKGKWYCPLCRGDKTNTLKTPVIK